MKFFFLWKIHFLFYFLLVSSASPLKTTNNKSNPTKTDQLNSKSRHAQVSTVFNGTIKIDPKKKRLNRNRNNVNKGKILF